MSLQLLQNQEFNMFPLVQYLNFKNHEDMRWKGMSMVIYVLQSLGVRE